MNEDTPLISIQSAPLDMLVRFDRRKRVVKIPVDLLPRLNVRLLDRTIVFTLNHSFKTTIEGEVVHSKAYESGSGFQSTISICPDPSDWPEPCETYAALYCAAICVAMKQAAEKEDPETCCRPRVVKKQWGISPISPFLPTVEVGYGFPVPPTGKELLTIIKRRLDLARDELLGVSEVLSMGPIPNTTPDWN